MKIDSDRMLTSLNLPKHEDVEKGGDAARGTEQNNRASVDRVDISISKDALDKLGEMLSAMSRERSDRIASLKREVSSGTYQVDAKQVAKKMLESWKGNN